VFLGQVDESNVCQAPFEIVMFYYFKGGGRVTKVGVIVNQMVTEASGVSLDNGQTFLTPPKRQCYDRLNQNYFEIIVWHLTPRWKIILMGSDGRTPLK